MMCNLESPSVRFDRRAFLGLAAVIGAASIPRLAYSQTQPILTVRPSWQDAYSFDEEQISSLPWRDIVTHTQWTEGVQTFRGPLLRDVLVPFAGTRDSIEPRQLRMTALNDFVVNVPASDAWAFDPILAREMNGSPMRIRDKGPLWLVYPRDQRKELQTSVIDERWIWQLVDIYIP